MEYRNTSHSRLFGLNPLACVAIVAVALALVGMAYFNYRAKAREAETAAEFMRAFGGVLEMQKRTEKSIEQFRQETRQPTPPASDPPARLPAYNSPQTPSPYSTP